MAAFPFCAKNCAIGCKKIITSSLVSMSLILTVTHGGGVFVDIKMFAAKDCVSIFYSMYKDNHLLSGLDVPDFDDTGRNLRLSNDNGLQSLHDMITVYQYFSKQKSPTEVKILMIHFSGLFFEKRRENFSDSQGHIR